MCRQVLHAARLAAQPVQDALGGAAGGGLGWCAQVLHAAGCADLADEARLLQAGALLRAGRLDAAASLLQAGLLGTGLNPAGFSGPDQVLKWP